MYNARRFTLPHAISLFFLDFIAYPAFSTANGECYYPGPTFATGFAPCQQFEVGSLCCPTGWVCFSNHVCALTDPALVTTQWPFGSVIRGTCTNPQWNDTACGNFCKDMPVNQNEGALVPCGDNRFCCKPDSDRGLCDCVSGKGTFSVEAGTAQTMIGRAGLPYTSTSTILISASRSSASPSSTTSKLSTPTSGFSTVSRSSTSSFASGSASILANTTVARKSQSTGLKAGISIGAIVVLLAICGFVLLYLLKRKRKHNNIWQDQKAQQQVQQTTTPTDLFQAPDSPGSNTVHSSSRSRTGIAANPLILNPYSPSGDHSLSQKGSNFQQENGDRIEREPTPGRRGDLPPPSTISAESLYPLHYQAYRPIDPDVGTVGLYTPIADIPPRRPVYGSGTLPGVAE